jgi:hypothetical protein
MPCEPLTAHAPSRGRFAQTALALGVAVVAFSAMAPPGAAAKRVTVTAALQGLERSGAITEALYGQYEGVYVAAKTSLRRLSGTRRQELGAVLANVEAMGAKGQLIPSRLPVVFTTVERNRQWWTTQALPGGSQRVSFTGSRLVWEYYPGQGIEIQWLGTFGEANGYYNSHQTTALREVLSEAVALATRRAGGIAWEYMFQFDGGVPPWTSGLSQGTALQALSRAYARTHEAEFLDAAKEALGIFKTHPSTGVRVPTSVGAHYLEYTYAPGERILNGFIQSLVGLYEYAKLTGDPVGQQLFDAGDAEGRVEVPTYDTGAWSLYDQTSESNLNYHELLAEFLEHLCERTSKGKPLTPTSGQIAGDEIYCTTAKRFRADEKTPPAIELLTHSVHAKERAGVQMKLSKISTVSMRIKLGEKTVWTNTVTVEGGRPRLLWVTPSKAGLYTVELRATDLAGNEEAASGTITVKATTKRARKSARVARVQRISPLARRLPTL